MPQSNTRHEIGEGSITAAMTALKSMMEFRLNQKGRGTFASSHEMLGIITEEYHELVQAVTATTETHSRKNGLLRHELLDIAVGCIFGVACLDEGEMDWL